MTKVYENREYVLSGKAGPFPPTPDDEALERIIRDAKLKALQVEDVPRAILKALREAGALR